jgi:pyruvate,water dikinase
MDWQPLKRFRDPSVPKLNNLRRAAAAGLRVPPTWWLPAGAVLPETAVEPPARLGAGPLIIRSASPTEDQRTTSNAGQFLSVVVQDRATFATAVRRVITALPRDAQGVPRGAVFVQPFLVAREAGVVFFDGFHYERALVAGSNEAVTSGQARGEVQRGNLQRGEPWSVWLASVYSVFGIEAHGGDLRLDMEFARDETGYVLLQVRSALFPVRRNEILTQANSKETLGETPSPWIASAFTEAAGDPQLWQALDPRIANWHEPAIVVLGGRVWLNMCFLFRGTESLGLPRKYALRTLGGDVEGTAAEPLALGRFLLSLPGMFVLAVRGFKLDLGAKAALRELDREIEAAEGLEDLYQVTLKALNRLMVRATAIVAFLQAVFTIRRFLHLPGASRVVTHEMMEEYRLLAALPDAAAREAGLDRWLVCYGHRGPLESDLGRPRFAELRAVLLQDLLNLPHMAPVAAVASGSGVRRVTNWLLRPCYWPDERREAFRDAIMRCWQRLRQRLLEEGSRLVAAGKLDAPEDVFWLQGSDLKQAVPFCEAVAAARAYAEAVRDVKLPVWSTREEIEALLASAATVPAETSGRRIFPGIALARTVLEGHAVKAKDLISLLADGAKNGRLGPGSILVVPALEPSWAVLFPRVGGVVAEVGGELSHASILLREAGRPAVVNCAGIFDQVRTGDRLRLDGVRGVVEVLEQAV